VTAVRAALDRAGQELETARQLLEPGDATRAKLAVRLALFEVRQAIVALDAPAQVEPPAVMVAAPSVAPLDPASLTVTLLPDQGRGGAPRYQVVDPAGSGEPHLVTVTPPWCNCSDFRYRRELKGEVCKHLAAAAHVQERATSGAARDPAGERTDERRPRDGKDPDVADGPA